MRFQRADGPWFQRGQYGTGVGAFLRPIGRFLKKWVLPSVSKAVKSETGQKTVSALKKTAGNIVSDMVSGKSSVKSRAKELGRLKTKVENALIEKAESNIKSGIRKVKKVKTGQKKKTRKKKSSFFGRI